MAFLRWAGSKKQLIPILSEYWSADGNQRYVEPFAGSACLFFKIEPKRAILGDINKELIEVYEQVKQNPPAVLSELKKLKLGVKAYYQVRDHVEVNLLSPTQRAARFIYLNRYCYNGIYRVNKLGHFNVPYGGDKSGNLPTDIFLANCSKVLKKARLVQGDFEKTLRLAKKGDFVYIDPPYRVAAKRVFSEYIPSSFENKDLARLRYWMQKLDDLEITFVVSYALCEEANYLKRGFYSKLVKVRRNISGFIGSRKMADEILISNISI